MIALASWSVSGLELIFNHKNYALPNHPIASLQPSLFIIDISWHRMTKTINLSVYINYF